MSKNTQLGNLVNGIYVDSTGKVGVGTSSPLTNITVGDSATQQQPYLSLARTATGGYFAGIRFYDGTNIKSYIQEDADFNLRFGTSNTERMRIANSGSVGIGTNNPTNTLDVAAPQYPFIVITGTNSSQVQAQFGVNQVLQASYFGTNTNHPLVIHTNGTEKMRISSSGIITQPSQPFVMGGLDGNQSVSLSTFTIINFSTTTGGFYYANVNNCWNNSTRTFTAPVTGVYVVNASILTNAVGQIALFVNGSRKHSIPSWYASSSVTWGGSAIIPLTAGDALTLQGYGNGGSITQNEYHSWFAIYLLG